MTQLPSLTRRSVLRASTLASGAACALALAGCSTAAPGTDAAPEATASAIPTTGTPVKVGKVSEVPVGESASGTANGVKVLIFRPDEKTVLAFSATCTHAQCTVGPQGNQFVCPCHGSTYNAADGSVVVGPARQALPRYAAAIDGEWITVKV
jgi:cytochrome b6-f complex iron-sulfur subunit